GFPEFLLSIFEFRSSFVIPTGAPASFAGAEWRDRATPLIHATGRTADALPTSAAETPAHPPDICSAHCAFLSRCHICSATGTQYFRTHSVPSYETGNTARIARKKSASHQRSSSPTQIPFPTLALSGERPNPPPLPPATPSLAGNSSRWSLPRETPLSVRPARHHRIPRARSHPLLLPTAPEHTSRCCIPRKRAAAKLRAAECTRTPG